MQPETFLSPAHIKQLVEQSGIDEQVIRERGYRTIEQATELHQLGFAAAQARTAPGLLIPQWGTDGGNGHYVFRPDQPRVLNAGKKPKLVKYEMPKGAGGRIDCPPRCKEQLADPAITLWITEGTKKADAAVSH